MSFLAGWQRRGQEILQEQQEQRAAKHMKILEHQAAQQAQAQDLTILERLHQSGRPVTGENIVMEDKTLPAGQIIRTARPADRSRLMNYTDSTGQRHAYERFSKDEEIQRQIDAKVAETKAVGGAQTAVGLDRMTKQAKVEDEIDAGRAIPMPAVFAAAMPGQEKLPPSQFNLAAHLATAKSQEDRNKNAVKVAELNNARMVAIQTSKNLLDWQKFTKHEAGLESRFRQSEVNRFARARMTAAKESGLSDKEATKLTSDARKLYDEEIATHQLADKIGMMAKSGIYADGKGNPVFAQGQPIKSDESNAPIMEAQVKALKARAEALKQQRLRLEADMGGKTPLYEGSIGQKGGAVRGITNSILDSIFGGEARIGK